MEQHDCTQVLSKVFLALDGELSPEEEKEFLEHIEKCNGCLEQYKVEKGFKTFLKNKVAKKNISSKVVDRIREQISALKS